MKIIFLIASLLLWSGALYAQDDEPLVVQKPVSKQFMKRHFIAGAGFGAGRNELDNTFLLADLQPRLTLFEPLPDLSLSFAEPFGAGIMTENGMAVKFGSFTEIGLGRAATKDSYWPVGFSAGGGYSSVYCASKLYSGFAVTGSFRFGIMGRIVQLRYEHLFSNRATPMSDFAAIEVLLGNWMKSNKRNNKISRFMKPYRKH